MERRCEKWRETRGDGALGRGRGSAASLLNRARASLWLPEARAGPDLASSFYQGIPVALPGPFLITAGAPAFPPSLAASPASACWPSPSLSYCFFLFFFNF